MAWYNSIIGGGTSNNYINPAATPGGLMNATSTAGSILQTTSSQNYWATAQAQSVFSEHQNKMYTIKNYADAIGWEVSHHHLPVGMTSDDPKIAMLKLLNVGEVLKDVGVRTSDTDYYIMRAPNE